MKLTRKQLITLFCGSIDNAFNLYQAASKSLFQKEHEKYPSLGLAELALEELGKSYSCLAMISICDATKDWGPFWKEWRDHDLKAHRAFFYEFFSLLRLEVDFDGVELEFPTQRQKFSREKEAAFYVDINKGSGKIHLPAAEISDEECIRRVTSLMGLFNAAFYVKDWMTEDHPDAFKNAISDYAYRTLTTNMYQQDALGILEKMKGTDKDYNEGLAQIVALFTPKPE